MFGRDVWGAKVWPVLLMARVAERRGLSCRTRLRRARSVAFWVAGGGQRLKDDGQTVPIASGVRWNLGPACRSALLIWSDLLDVPETVIQPDHLCRPMVVAEGADGLGGAVQVAECIQGQQQPDERHDPTLEHRPLVWENILIGGHRSRSEPRRLRATQRMNQLRCVLSTSAQC